MNTQETGEWDTYNRHQMAQCWVADKYSKASIKTMVKALNTTVFKALNYITMTIIQQIQSQNREQPTKILKLKTYSN